MKEGAFFMYMIKEMPMTSRPRERLKNDGLHQLSKEELIAILLRTGYKDLSVIELSKHVLYHLDSFYDLKKITFEELLMIKGIKEAKAATLLAGIELGRRLAEEKHLKKQRINSGFDVYHLLYSHLSRMDQEHFICLYLNTKSEIIKQETIFIGTINQTLIHPREIFRNAIKYAAAGVIFVHNHPTGDSMPSKADMKATEQLVESSLTLGIDVIDHIIIGHQEFYSIKEDKKFLLS